MIVNLSHQQNKIKKFKIRIYHAAKNCIFLIELLDYDMCENYLHCGINIKNSNRKHEKIWFLYQNINIRSEKPGNLKYLYFLSMWIICMMFIKENGIW